MTKDDENQASRGAGDARPIDKEIPQVRAISTIVPVTEPEGLAATVRASPNVTPTVNPPITSKRQQLKEKRSAPATQPGAVAVSAEESSPSMPEPEGLAVTARASPTVNPPISSRRQLLKEKRSAPATQPGAVAVSADEVESSPSMPEPEGLAVTARASSTVNPPIASRRQLLKEKRSAPATKPGAVAVSADEVESSLSMPEPEGLAVTGRASSTVNPPITSKRQQLKEKRSAPATKPGAVAVSADDIESSLSMPVESSPSMPEPEGLAVTNATPKITSKRQLSKEKRGAPATKPGAVAVSESLAEPEGLAASVSNEETGLADVPQSEGVAAAFARKRQERKEKRSVPASIPGAVAVSVSNEETGLTDLPRSSTDRSASHKGRDRFQSKRQQGGSKRNQDGSMTPPKGREGDVISLTDVPRSSTDRSTSHKGRDRFQSKRQQDGSKRNQNGSMTPPRGREGDVSAAAAASTTSPTNAKERFGGGAASRPGAVAVDEEVGGILSAKERYARGGPRSRARVTTNATEGTDDLIVGSEQQPGVMAITGAEAVAAGSVLASKERLARGRSGARGKAQDSTNVTEGTGDLIAGSEQQPGVMVITGAEADAVGGVLAAKNRLHSRRGKRGELVSSPDDVSVAATTSLPVQIVMSTATSDGGYGAKSTLTSANAANSYADTKRTLDNYVPEIANGTTAAIATDQAYVTPHPEVANDTAAAFATEQAYATSHPESGDASFVVIHPEMAEFAVIHPEEPKQEEPRCSRRTRWIIIAVIAVAFIGGVVGAVVGLSGGSASVPTISPTTAPTPTPSSPPSPVPSLAPTEGFTVSAEEAQRWKDLIQAASPSTSFDDATSPPSLALEWLSSEPTAARLRDVLLLQRFALITLWYSTKGSDWKPSEKAWLSSDDECGWEGVTCSPVVGGFVKQLILEGLFGTIPVEVALLSQLALFHVDAASLNGVIPTEIGLLTDMYSLLLSDNDLEGAIPTELGQLTLMEFLHLDENGLNGTVPEELSQLTALKKLSLSKNKLEGPIPLNRNMTNLVEVDLATNKLEGTIPSEIGALTKLTYLSLSNNKLGGIPSELGLLRALQKLRLFNDKLQGTIPREIGRLIALTEIDLGNNGLSGTVPADLGRLTNLGLRDLKLSGNDLTGSIPAEVCDHTVAIVDCGEITCESKCCQSRNGCPCSDATCSSAG